jgi:hypothetical protein
MQRNIHVSFALEAEMDKETLNTLIVLVGPLLGFASAWFFHHFSHRQRMKEAQVGRVREPQVDIVTVLCERLYSVETTWSRLQDLDLEDDTERQTIVKEMLESEKHLRDDYNKNRLWINQVLEKEIEAIVPKLRDAIRNYKLSSLVGGPMSSEDKHKAWQSVRGTVNEDIARMRKGLEQRFRALVEVA